MENRTLNVISSCDFRTETLRFPNRNPFSCGTSGNLALAMSAGQRFAIVILGRGHLFHLYPPSVFWRTRGDPQKHQNETPRAHLENQDSQQIGILT